MGSGNKVVKWAAEHPEEILVVCGLRHTGNRRTYQIWRMLREDGLEELSEMMAMRFLQMNFEDDPKSVQAEKEAIEEFKKSQHSGDSDT